jgi:hypothetical protein
MHLFWEQRGAGLRVCPHPAIVWRVRVTGEKMARSSGCEFLMKKTPGHLLSTFRMLMAVLANPSLSAHTNSAPPEAFITAISRISALGPSGRTRAAVTWRSRGRRA